MEAATATPGPTDLEGAAFEANLFKKIKQAFTKAKNKLGTKQRPRMLVPFAASKAKPADEGGKLLSQIVMDPMALDGRVMKTDSVKVTIVDLDRGSKFFLQVRLHVCIFSVADSV